MIWIMRLLVVVTTVSLVFVFRAHVPPGATAVCVMDTAIVYVCWARAERYV